MVSKTAEWLHSGQRSCVGSTICTWSQGSISSFPFSSFASLDAERMRTGTAPVPYKKVKILTVHTCESTSNQPPTSTGQTHRIKDTTSKAYQSHGGSFRGKIFVLTEVIFNIFKQDLSWNYRNYGNTSNCTWDMFETRSWIIFNLCFTIYILYLTSWTKTYWKIWICYVRNSSVLGTVK